MITEMIKSVIDYVNSISGGNQMIGGAITVAVTGTVGYLIKDVPRKLYKLFTRHLTTSMTISNQNTSYFRFMEWLELNQYSNSYRIFRLINGRWGQEKKTIKSVGYGSHFFFIDMMPVVITVNQLTSNGDRDREEVVITKFGRSHKFFTKIITAIQSDVIVESRTKVYMYNECWELMASQVARPLTSVIIPNEQKTELITKFNEFVSSEQFFIDNHIPWQLGIMLYGPPGTGKTSMIRAIAAHFNRSVSIIPASAMDDLIDVFSEIPENTIVVIEDIDSAKCITKRKSSDDADEDESAIKALSDAVANGKGSLSNVLNALDGITHKHGRILIITTNHPEQLDAALVRPGRIDIKLEIGYVTKEMLLTFLRRFYSTLPTISESDFEMTNNTLVMATLQNHMLEHMTWQDIMNKYTNYKG